MPLAEIRKETERRMVTSIDALKAELKHLRTGRASVALLEGVQVEYYGTPTPLNQCANLAVADARLITVRPWDKNMVPALVKACRTPPADPRARDCRRAARRGSSGRRSCDG